MINNSPSSTPKPVGQTNRNGMNNGKSNNIFGSDIALEGLLVPLKRKYLFKKRLGIGNFAKVYLVHQIHLNKDFALKILDFNYILGILERNNRDDIPGEFSKIKERFINEAAVLKKIKHPNIVEIDDLDIIPDETRKIEVPYFTMDYINGTTLREKIEKEGPLSMESALRISRDILSALQAIHARDIIHRDIKPDNIILEEASNKAILVDFGIAKDYRSNSLLTSMGSLLGTPRYMSPEQIKCQGDLILKTDIYSFGVVLFEMLTGKIPFEGTDILLKHQNSPVPDVRKINPELPEGIEKIIKKAMAKDPQNRYHDAKEFIDALKKLPGKNEPEDSDLEIVKNEIQKEYEIKEKLNSGGFAKIHLVRYIKLDDLRVLKVMRYSYLLNEKGEKQVEEFKERFEREGKLLAKIKHENIVKIHDIGKAGKSEIPYLIMEYIRGKSLAEVMKERKKFPLDFNTALNIAENVLLVLDIMHTKLEKPIIHRDIKPSNIMIEEKTGKAILIDLGIAKDKLVEKDLTVAGSSIGTPAYMSPEQCKGLMDLSPAADIYALGVVLFEMLAGEVPFKSEDNERIAVMYAHSYTPAPNIREKRPDLPPGIEQIIFKAMEKDPKARYQSAVEFLNALRELKEIYKDNDYSKKQDEQESKEKEKEKGKNENTEGEEKSTESIGKKEKTIVEKEPAKEQEQKPGNPGDEKKNPQKGEIGPQEKPLESAPVVEIKIKDKEEKSKRKLRWIISISILIVTAFIVSSVFIYIRFIEPGNRYRELIGTANRYIENSQYEKARGLLTDALEMKETQEVRWLLETVANKQKDNMSKDFQALNDILATGTPIQEKIGKCREFLKRHQNVSPNDQTKEMVSEINRQIDKLEKESKAEEQNRLQFDKMKADYEKLQGELNGSAPPDEKIGQSRAFLETYKQLPSNAETDGMRSEIQRTLSVLEAGILEEITKENQYLAYIKSVNYYLNTGSYSTAAEFLKKAKQVKDTPEVNRLAVQIEMKIREEEMKNGNQVYNAIKDPVNLKKYLEFKVQYPGSSHLPDLKERLKAVDKVLPPEKYWDSPIKKNNKGYYEYRFGPENNGHLMIYIPGKKFWIDKYEVSNLQYRDFLKAVNRKSSTPIGDDGNPAVVEYEEAESYCEKYGFRLPTEAEWEYAASGGKDIEYPWGNESPDANGIYRANFDSFEDGYKVTSPVKSYEKFSSPFGVVNMAGNVWEWIQEKKLKGGAFSSEMEDLKIVKMTTGKSGGKNGFRCLKQETGD